MTAGWNDLPPEMRVMIIYRLDFISRAKLSACAKMEQQLVRSTPFKLDTIEIRERNIDLKQAGSWIKIEMTINSCTVVWLKIRKRIVVHEHPKEAVKKIFKLLGTKCIVGKFTFHVESNFIDMIEWFRDNFNFSPNTVKVIVNDACDDIEPFLNWPNNVKISLNCSNYRGPIFERLDKYDNIVEFRYFESQYDIKNADTKLMKLPNCTRITILKCDITFDGFLWWLKQWLVRDVTYKKLFFRATFHPPLRFIKVDEMKNGLGDFLINTHTGRSGLESDGQHFSVRNKLNGRVGRILLTESTIIFEI